MKKIFSPIKLNDWVDISRVKNLVPGTLVYRGKVKENFMIDTFIYNEATCEQRQFPSYKLFSAYLEGFGDTQDYVVWINVTGINQVNEIEAIGRHFHIPNTLLEQVLNITKHSMYKFEKEYIFNDTQMIYLKDKLVEVENVSIYRRDQFVITFQEKKGDIFESLRERTSKSTGYTRENSSEYLYYCLLDALVDNYLDVMVKVKFDINLLEEVMIEGGSMDMNSIHQLRKTLLILRLTVSPLEKLIDQMSVSEHYSFEINGEVYIENLRDHTRELINDLTLQKEVVNSLFENYMLNNGNEMNQVMTILTIFSAIFIPLSFLAGVFGMNFENIPGLNTGNGFYVMIGFCLVLAISMISFFKWKKWF